MVEARDVCGRRNVPNRKQNLKEHKKVGRLGFPTTTMTLTLEMVSAGDHWSFVDHARVSPRNWDGEDESKNLQDVEANGADAEKNEKLPRNSRGDVTHWHSHWGGRS